MSISLPHPDGGMRRNRNLRSCSAENPWRTAGTPQSSRRRRSHLPVAGKIWARAFRSASRIDFHCPKHPRAATWFAANARSRMTHQRDFPGARSPIRGKSVLCGTEALQALMRGATNRARLSVALPRFAACQLYLHLRATRCSPSRCQMHPRRLLPSIILQQSEIELLASVHAAKHRPEIRLHLPRRNGTECSLMQGGVLPSRLQH